MRFGFTYKGKHSSEFGITAKSKSRPILPSMKYSSFESPAMDGVYDFSASNQYGHAFYNDRFFEIQIQVSAKDMRALEKKVSKIAVWLKGKGELVFDDMPFVKWQAKIVSEMGFVPEIRGSATVMTAVFRVEPFSVCFFDTADGPMLESVIELDTNLPVDVPEQFTWSFAGAEGQYESVSKTIRVVNVGDVEVLPVIRINGQVKNIGIVCGSQILAVDTSGSGFVIDCKRHIITDADGVSVMTKAAGNFPEIGIGVSEIRLSMSVKGVAEVRVEYTPRFVYDCDFDDVDWGESNA